MTKRPNLAAGRSSETTGRTSDSTIPAASDTTAVTRYLRVLIGRCDGEIPLIADLQAHQLGTPASTASISRAALCWLLDGQPSAVEDRLRAELAEADQLAVLRTRQAWAEFESSWREFRHGRSHMVSFAELERLRRYEPEAV